MAALLFLCLVHAGCGLGPFAEEGGGADNLPSLGAGPYRVLPTDFDTPADEPYVVAQPIVSLLDPTVLERSAGGFEIFFTRTDDTTSEIWSVGLASITELPDSSPRQILVADSEWEQNTIGAASLVEDGDRLVLYYQGGVDSPGIGRAESTDGGATFVKDAGNPVLAAGIDPQVSFARGRWVLVYADPDMTAIHLRESEDGQQFGPARQLIAARTARPRAFDGLGVRAPSLHITETLRGDEHYGLFYSGLGLNPDNETTESIGYQGSFGGEDWQRFLAGEPILQPGPAGAGGAAPVIGASSSLLFFHQLRQGRGRIAVAVSP